MTFPSSVATILKETFAAPLSGSYIVPTKHGDIIIRQRGHYEGLDLTGADLSGLDLSDTDLRKSKLIDVKLNGTNFSGANLAGSILERVEASGAKFDGANLEGSTVADVTFEIPPSGLSLTRE
jgi:uncharacterized protein YjbI with pentapeptide repeats